MTDTTIRVPEELADELHDRKQRGDSYADVIWRLLEQADAADRERARAAREPTEADADPEAVSATAASDTTNTAEQQQRVSASAAWVVEHLDDVEFPQGQQREDCVQAVAAAHAHLYEHGSATKGEIVQAVMPDHPLGYDTEAALAKVEEPGERFRGAWWRRVVKPGLGALPDVEAPSGGRSAWRHVA